MEKLSLPYQKPAGASPAALDAAALAAAPTTTHTASHCRTRARPDAVRPLTLTCVASHRDRRTVLTPMPASNQPSSPPAARASDTSTAKLPVSSPPRGLRREAGT